MSHRNASAAVAPTTCHSAHFEVPFHMTDDHWVEKVVLAHRVFALCIIAVMSAYCLLLLELTSVPRAYIASGDTTPPPALSQLNPS